MEIIRKFGTTPAITREHKKPLGTLDNIRRSEMFYFTNIALIVALLSAGKAVWGKAVWGS